MRFSCFPRANIMGQRGSMNLAPLAGSDESNNVVGISIVSTRIRYFLVEIGADSSALLRGRARRLETCFYLGSREDWCPMRSR